MRYARARLSSLLRDWHRTLGSVLVVALLILAGIGLLSTAAHSPSAPADVATLIAGSDAARAPSASPSPASAPAVPFSGATAGDVVETAYVNYNASTSGNFPSSVWSWQVGQAAVDPATDQLWIPTVPVVRAGVPAPASSPALIYDPATNQTSTVPSLTDTSAFAFEPLNGYLYATDPLNHSVAVFDPSSMSWIPPAIPVGRDPTAIAYDPASENLFVANKASNNVTVINGTSSAVQVAGIPTGVAPIALADDPVDKQIYTANSGSANVSRISTASNTVQGNPGPYADPSAIACSEETDTIALGIPTLTTLVLLDAKTGGFLSAPVVGANVSSVVSDLNGSEYLLANNSGTHVTVVNSTTYAVELGGIAVKKTPLKLYVDPTDGELLAWSNKSRVVVEVSLAQSHMIQAAPNLGVRASDLAYDPSSGRALVLDRSDDAVDFLNASTLQTEREPLLLPGPPDSVVEDDATSTAYVGFVGGIFAIDPATGAITGSNDSLPGNNSDLVINAASGLLWDLNNASGLIALELPTLTGVVDTGLGVGTVNIRGTTLDNLTNEIFFVNLDLTTPADSTIDILNGTTGATELPAITSIPDLISVAYDPADQMVYALAENGVWIIDPATGAVEAGPIAIGPHAMAWSITYDPSRAFLYVATTDAPAYAGNLTVIDGSSVEASEGSIVTIPVGQLPLVAVPVLLAGSSAPGSGEIWVGNDASGTVSVLAGPPQITYLAASPNPVDANVATHILLGYLGGAGPSTITYSGLPSSCASVNSTELNCTATSDGTYTITAEVVDSLGFNASEQTVLSVSPSFHVHVSLSGVHSGGVDAGDSFTASATVSGGTAPMSYKWFFGDGTSATGAEVTHTYDTTGTYLVTVTSADSGGGVSSSTTMVDVAPLPTAAVAASPTNVTDVNVAVGLNATVAGGTTPGNWTWTLGDGTIAYGADVRHAYATTGVYFARFVYTDASGHNATEYLSIQVNPKLSASLVAQPSSSGVNTGTTVQFTAAISGGTEPYTIVWGFDDGSFGSGVSVSHTYANAGSYAITLFIEDAVGAEWNTTYHLDVSSPSASLVGPSLLAGLFLGIVVGAAAAAIVLFVAGRSRRHRPPPPSPYVPPAPAAAPVVRGAAPKPAAPTTPAAPPPPHRDPWEEG